MLLITQCSDSHPLRQMIRFVSNMLWFRNLDENRYIGFKSDSKDYLDFIFEEDTLHEFEEFLHITGIKEDLVAIKDADGVKRLYFNTDTPLPFLRWLQVELVRYIHFSIGIKLPKMCHLCM